MTLYHFSRIDRQTKAFFKFCCAVAVLWLLVYIQYATVRQPDDEEDNLIHHHGFRHMAPSVGTDNEANLQGEDDGLMDVISFRKRNFNQDLDKLDKAEERFPFMVEEKESNDESRGDVLFKDGVDDKGIWQMDNLLNAGVEFEAANRRGMDDPVPAVQGLAGDKQRKEKDVEALRRERTADHIKLKATLNEIVPLSAASAPGELGRGVRLNTSSLSDRARTLIAKGYNDTGFNAYISDMISVRRRKLDLRPKECQKEVYPIDLPRTSVIICFHNEAVSTLLRTVYSVLDHTPPHLLHEIILVDDFSNLDSLGSPLDDLVARLPRVRLVRASSRLGLVGARLLGTSSATAPVLTFLDSHVECMQGWLEPMLDEIRRSEFTVSFPILNGIDKDDFRIFGVELYFQGLFNWIDLSYLPRPFSQADIDRRKSKVQPIKSPTMPGGIFSISRRYFELLGRYDPGLKLWGSENMELSFKVWMCNGSVVQLPCSHVAHVFRSFNPTLGTNPYSTILRNAMRVAYVWMDEYKYFFFNNIDKQYHQVPAFGDVSERVTLRRRLHCKNFAWYMNTVARNQFTPVTGLAVQQIENLGVENACISHSVWQNKLVHGDCSRHNTQMRLWYYWEGRLVAGSLKLGETWMCLAVDNYRLVLTGSCSPSLNPAQQWIHALDNSLRNVLLKKCVELSSADTVHLADCTGSANQKWSFRPVSYVLK